MKVGGHMSILEDVRPNVTGTVFEANVRALLSKTGDTKPCLEAGISAINDERTIVVKDCQVENVSFTTAGEEASLPIGQTRKEPAWRAASELPDVPKMLYRLAGENGFSMSSVEICATLTRASLIRRIVFKVDGEGGGYV